MAVSRALVVSEGRYGSAADLRLNYVQMLLGKHAPKHAPAPTSEEGCFPPFFCCRHSWERVWVRVWERVSRSLAAGAGRPARVRQKSGSVVPKPSPCAICEQWRSATAAEPFSRERGVRRAGR